MTISIGKIYQKKYLWKKNSSRYGCRNYFKLDEKTPRVDEMKIDQLKKILNGFSENLYFEYDLKKKIGLI